MGKKNNNLGQFKMRKGRQNCPQCHGKPWGSADCPKCHGKGKI